MFVLVVLKDTVRVAPTNFDKDHEAALVDALHAKYANRVLSGHGLCLAVDGFDSKAEPVIYANDGGGHVRVQFRLVVFRPFVSEVIIGRIRQCDASGLLVSLDFFDHIFIPKDALQPNSEFNHEENIWVWNFGGHELSMDVGEDIQFRVVSVEFGKRRTPAEAAAAAAVASAAGAATVDPVTGAPMAAALGGVAPEDKVNCLADLKPPLRVVGTIAEDGLGIVSWWTEAKPDEADAAGDAEATADGEAGGAPAAADGADAASAPPAAAAPADAGAFVDPSAAAVAPAAAAAETPAPAVAAAPMALG